MTLEHEKINAQVQEIFNIRLKSQQTTAIHQIRYQRKNLILIVKTDFGKSIMFQAAPLVSDSDNIALILMFLIALKEKQCLKLQAIVNIRLIVLSEDNNTAKNRETIRNEEYTHSRTSLSGPCLDDTTNGGQG